LRSLDLALITRCWVAAARPTEESGKHRPDHFPLAALPPQRRFGQPPRDSILLGVACLISYARPWDGAAGKVIG
jgi:hypothetical protein